MYLISFDFVYFLLLAFEAPPTSRNNPAALIVLLKGNKIAIQH